MQHHERLAGGGPAGAASLLALALVGVAAAQNPATSVTDELRELESLLDTVRTENAELRQALDTLQEEARAEWLTEHRTTAIRDLVADILADADRRANLVGDGIMAGWSDNFFLASGDGRFKLVLDGQLQTRWNFNYSERDNTSGDRYVYGFENTRSRLTVRGNIFGDEWEYLLRIGYSRPTSTGDEFDDHLHDAWARYRGGEDWAVRVGLFKLPFMRESMVSSAHQLAVERTLVEGRLTLDRSQGVELSRIGETWRGSLALSNGSNSLANGIDPPPVSSLAEDVNFAVTGRIEQLVAGDWAQFDDFTSPPGQDPGILWGLAAHVQKNERIDDNVSFGRTETDYHGITTDLSFERGGSNLFASLTWVNLASSSSSINNTNWLGVVVQGGYYTTPKVELFSRFELGKVRDAADSAIDTSELDLLTVGVNWYLDGHDLKWTTDLGVSFGQVSSIFANDQATWRADADHMDQMVLRSQLQILF